MKLFDVCFGRVITEFVLIYTELIFLVRFDITLCL